MVTFTTPTTVCDGVQYIYIKVGFYVWGAYILLGSSKISLVINLKNLFIFFCSNFSKRATMFVIQV